MAPVGAAGVPPAVWRGAAAWVVLVWGLLFVLRLAGPDDLMDKDQENPAAYIQDAAINGNWVIQTDLAGDISSKPPLYTWLAAVATVLAGEISEWTLYWASGLATLGVALLLSWAGGRHWGARAGLVAALVYLVSGAVAKQMALARTDGVFTFTVTLTALLAYRAWSTGKGWTWFWVGAAVATLAKGPAGLVFGAGGLVAVLWERRAGSTGGGVGRTGGPVGAHLLGVVLYVLIVGGWFVAAWLDMGAPVIDKMIHRELLGHATGSTTGRLPGSEFYKPPLLFLARYAPWSVVAMLGFWRVWRQPAAERSARAFERFLFCWFWVGLGVLGLGAHHRGDLLNPMLPAAALLAGREVDRWLARLRPAQVRGVLAGGVALGLVLIAGKYYGLRPMDRYVKQTAEVKALAARLEAQVGAGFPFSYLEAPYGLQVYLDTLHRAGSAERTRELLQGRAAAFVWVGAAGALGDLTNGPGSVYLLEEVPLTERPGLRLLSNRSHLAWENDIGMCLGPLDVRMVGVRPRRVADRRLEFEGLPGPEGGAARHVELRNRSSGPWEVRVRFGGGGDWRRRLLAPGAVWRIEVGRP